MEAPYFIFLLLIAQNSLALVSSDSSGEENVYLEIPKISIAHKKLPCQLEWRNTTKGLGANKDFVTISSRHIGRVKIFGQYTFGLISPQRDLSTGHAGIFYSSKEGRFLELGNYEILTNPNKCHLIWESMGVEGGGWVCRTPYCVGRRTNATYLEICTPSEDFKKCVPSQKSRIKNFMDFEVLRSIKSTLDYRVDDLKPMENEILDVVNFSGSDRILNKANVEVETSINQGSGYANEVGNEERHLLITGVNGANQNTKANYTKNSTAESIGAARGLRVPAFTSIEACSITNLPVLTFPVTVTVSFYAQGLVAEEIEEILEEAALNGPYVYIDKFTVQIELERTKGMLADLAVDTKFYVNPVNIHGSNSCDSIKNNMNEVRQQKILKLLENMKQRINHGEL